MNTALKTIPHSTTKTGDVVLPGYEWISFVSLAKALKWRKRNHRLKTAYNLDEAKALSK